MSSASGTPLIVPPFDPAISGAQFHLYAGGYEAVVSSVGASLRVLRDAHGDLIMPYAAERMRPAMRGAVLAPWPNRIADGRYEFNGRSHQLPLTEPQTGNAAHGLMAWHDFEMVSGDDTCVTLSGVIQAQLGYPWRVRVDVSYQLGAGGLRQSVLAHNQSDEPAPVGLGAHPYLVAGASVPGAADEWFLEVPADDILQITADRMLPTHVEPVQKRRGAFDFRQRRQVGSTVLNNAFGSLRRGADGLARVQLTNAEGSGVELACDPSVRWVQVYTADANGPTEHRHAIAVEPMTCPPGAFNSGVDLVAVEPGATHVAEWTLCRISDATACDRPQKRLDSPG